CLSVLQPPPLSTLFPYTTLFRSHYAVHSGPEDFRHRDDVPVSLHDFADTYAPAFRATVVEGKADSVMCAYNSVRGAHIVAMAKGDRKSTRLNSSHEWISYAVFCL